MVETLDTTAADFVNQYCSHLTEEERDYAQTLANSLVDRGVKLSTVFGLLAPTVTVTEQLPQATETKYRVITLARLPEGAAKGTKRKIAETETIIKETACDDYETAQGVAGVDREFAIKSLIPMRVQIQSAQVSVTEWENISAHGDNGQ